MYVIVTFYFNFNLQMCLKSAQACLGESITNLYGTSVIFKRLTLR